MAKARALFLFVRDEIRYNPYTFSTRRENYQAHAILARGKGYCVQKAVLLTALCRAVGIPTRLLLADIKNYQVPGNLMEVMQTNIFLCHGYNELWLNNRWVKATPTFDRFMCQRLGINPVDFDGSRDAVFDLHSKDGKLHIEYIRHREPFSDLPFEQIMATYEEKYGTERLERWQEAGRDHYDQ
ncbi:MAG: transglutaminase domain-containing protein [Deltaproteobacteria bacterium]|nr:transglutaminase domain-containing protein [Deltaproteobacteria bacterium]